MSFPAWIKIEVTTPDKPEVIAMAARLRVKDPDTVTGKLVRLWVWADANSIDGHAISITRSFVDRLTGCRGFAAAMEAVGWLEGGDGMVTFPGFDRHNGDSAKRRATEARRKQKTRGGGKRPQEDGTNVPPESGQKTDNGPTAGRKKAGQNADLEEEIEEEVKRERERAGEQSLAGMARRIVETYPRREKLASALAIVLGHLKAGEPAEAMLSGTKAAALAIAQAPSGHLNRFVPSSEAFFHGKRWQDDPATLLRAPEKNNGKGTLSEAELALQLGPRGAATEFGY